MSGFNYGLALGGGGARGIGHFGVMRVLEEKGLWPPRLIVGTSAGAIAAMMMSLGFSAERCIQLWQEMPESAIQKRRTWLRGAWAFLTSGGWNDNAPLFRTLLRVWKEQRTAAELARQTEALAVFVDGAYGLPQIEPATPDYVHRSCTIPLVWPASGGRYYDGGLVHPIPVDPLLRRGFLRMIAVGLNPAEPEYFDPPFTGIEAAHLTVERLTFEIGRANLGMMRDVTSYVRQAAAGGVILKHPSGAELLPAEPIEIRPERTYGSALEFTAANYGATLTEMTAAARRALAGIGPSWLDDVPKATPIASTTEPRFALDIVPAADLRRLRHLGQAWALELADRLESLGLDS